MAAKRVAVMVGTKKGAYIFRASASRGRWSAEGPLFPGEPVHHLAFDPRDGESMYAACNQSWGGPKIRISRDLGRTWKVTANPAFPKGKVATSNAWVQGEDWPRPVTAELAFARAWHIEPGHASQPRVMFVGVEPAALFRSDDRGATWTEVASLTDHPTRSQWSPGGGGLMVHSIAVDASGPERMQVGISAAGVFETTDGGRTWTPRNQGIPAPLSPDKDPDVGHCVHHLVAHPTVPGVRFQQNHFAVLWLRDGDARWANVSEGLPDACRVPKRDNAYGFAAAIHPHDPDAGYVIPLDGKDRRAPEPGIAVYGTRDRGRTWKRLARGLPRGARVEVMREGMAADRLDPAGIYFGTQSGDLWGSPDEGRTWTRIAQYLPPVMSVSAAVV